LFLDGVSKRTGEEIFRKAAWRVPALPLAPKAATSPMFVVNELGKLSTDSHNETVLMGARAPINPGVNGRPLLLRREEGITTR
jgi:hypothetical protein